MNKFTGFTEKDFDILGDKTDNLKERKDKIKSRIKPKLEDLAQEIEKKRSEWRIYPHYPTYNQYRVNLPTTCWLAFIQKEGKEYVTYAQLNVGLCKIDDLRIRLGSEIKGSDMPEFLEYIEKNKPAVKDIIDENSLKCFLSKNVPEDGELISRGQDMGLDEALCELKANSHKWKWFEIGKKYSKSDEIVKSLKLVEEAIKIFESLYCIYENVSTKR